MVSKKDKDIWIKDYLDTIKVLSREEIEFLEKPLMSEKYKKEYYFRTTDETENLDIWLIDPFNYDNLTVEIKALLEIVPKEKGCEIEIKFGKLKLFYLKAVIYFFSIFIFFFCAVSQSIGPAVFGVFFIFVFLFQKKIIYKKTQKRILQKLESIDEIKLVV